MRKVILLLALCNTWTWGQPTVAPTDEPVGMSRGENAGGYNILNSFETGYRFRDVNGNEGKYRSDVNFGNGIRLLGSNLRVNSRDGHGRFFDELLVSTQGLGNDPYEFSSVRINKNRAYRYDLLWRLNDYYNPALTIAGGRHLMSTQRRVQDHDFTLFPESWFKLFAGYTRNDQDGPALSTVQVFGSLGDEFPIFANVRRLRNEYRLGSEINLAGVRFTWMRGWDNFSETTPLSLTEPNPGDNPADETTLSQFRRVEPYRGATPYWRLNLYAERRVWSVNARYTYAGGRRRFFFDELTLGSDRFSPARNRQILISGAGTRPVSAGNLSFSLFPGRRVTFTNQTSFHNTRMNGNSTYAELENQSLNLDYLDFQFLGIRTVANTADLTWRVLPRIGIYSGYHFSNRRIRSTQAREAAGGGITIEGSQTNIVHSGLFGSTFQISPPLSLNLEAEVGRASRPFFPVSDRDYHALGARLQYRTRTLTLSGSARTNYNFNSVSVSSHSSRGRNYAFDASWSALQWLTFDANYSKIHLDTLSGIAYFANGAFVTGDQSIYVSNIHSTTSMAHLTLAKRVDLSLGYSRVQDLGDGRASLLGTRGGSTLPGFLAAQTFPLTFESPLARLSIRLADKVRWNVGYQFYHYGEEFLSFQNYRAHTGYTSVLWSF